jgi:hypothetical protein
VISVVQHVVQVPASDGKIGGDLLYGKKSGGLSADHGAMIDQGKALTSSIIRSPDYDW